MNKFSNAARMNKLSLVTRWTKNGTDLLGYTYLFINHAVFN